MKLSDKVVLITDARSPSGKAVASRFKAEGALIVENGSGECSSAGIEGIVRGALDRYGRIDILVHNNNEVIPASIEDCGDEAFDRAMGVNMKSAFYYARAAGPSMKKARRGNFIFISSIHGEKPGGGAFAYSLARGALKMFTRELALELGMYNIRVNLISAGPLEEEGDLFYSDMTPLYEHKKERILDHRIGVAGDLAGAALFFAVDEESRFANGTELTLDGGFLLTYFGWPTSGLPVMQREDSDE